MSDKPSGSTFPPDGKVLVVNMTLGSRAQLAFGKRVYWMNHWEFMQNPPVPEGVKALILPYAMKADAESKMRAWASKQGLKIVEVEYTSESLLKRLNTWLPAMAVSSTLIENAKGRNNSKGNGVPVKKQGPLQPEPSVGELAVDPRRVKPLENQPRSHFDSASEKELTTSIKAIGQITPAIVTKLDDDPEYDHQLIEGERRHKVCLKLGLKLLVVVRRVKDKNDHFKKSFAANFAREGHTALDTARSIRRMMVSDDPDLAGLGKVERLAAIGALAGKTGQWAYNYDRLMDLPLEVQAYLEPDEDSGRQALPQSVAAQLCGLQSKEVQIQVAKDAVRRNLSAAGVRFLIRQMANASGVKITKRGPDDDYRVFKTFLRKSVEGGEASLTLPGRTLDELFVNRPLEDRNETLKEIDDLIVLLGRIRNEIDLRKVVKKKK